MGYYRNKIVLFNFYKNLKMNSKYKYCGVPLCKSTSIKTPDKLFVYVPNTKKIRDKWLTLARRDPSAISLKSSIYFCEDHFDMPQDMENYTEYRLMGSVPKVRMKPGCIPSRFECQPDRRKRTSQTVERSYILNKQRRLAIEESLKEYEARNSLRDSATTQFENTSVGSGAINSREVVMVPNIPHSETNEDEDSQGVPKTTHKSVQINIRYKFRSKAIQTQIASVNQMTSPLKPSHHSVSTSPFNIKPFRYSNPSKKCLMTEEQSDSDISYTPSVTGLSPSIKSLHPHQVKSSSDCSDVIEENRKREASKFLECTLNRIIKNPRSYIGIPKQCYFLIDLIQEQTSIPFNHILLCLKKIRLNNTFQELADDFNMNATYASKIFSRNIPILASVMRPFIVKLDKTLSKRNLPLAFRQKYNHVSCIIDCLEIEIQKPSKAVNQALTWSEYKKANTIKYLVSCTPNGLVNYISVGFGGRITDTCLVESCDFLKCLQRGMCVMADRGFKHVETYLRKEGVLLVRPPSVTTGMKLTKSEAKETKRIASLRIHIERVIRRLREFRMLKPHACININLIKILDDCMTIACGLINLQDSLIK